MNYSDCLQTQQFAVNFCISLQNRYLYTPVPKVAHTTLKFLLSQLEVKGLPVTLSDLHVHQLLYSPFLHPYQLPDEMVESIFESPEFFRFLFVRDPIDRIISAYLDKIVNIDNPERPIIQQILGKREKETITLVEFLSAIKSQTVREMNLHWKPQTAIALWPRIQYDFVGRLEQFSSDVEAVFKRITGKPAAESIVIRSIRHHATNASDVSDEYLKDKAAKDLIEEIYADDFAAFSYSDRTTSRGTRPNHIVHSKGSVSVGPAPEAARSAATPTVAKSHVTDDDVRRCFGFILERQPKSVDVVRTLAASTPDFRALVAKLIGSPEHQRKPGSRLVLPPQPKPGAPAVTDGDVVWCYRSILGREPESADAIRTYVATAPNFRSLVLEFLESPEYKMKTGAGAASPQRKETSARPVTDDDVVWCYRFVLGREPESLDAIRTHAAAVPDFRSMLARLITSPEYRQKPGARLLPPPSRAPGNPAVTEDDVVWCYRSLLGREPESLDSIRTLVALAGDFRALVGEFVGTPEYRQKPGARPVLGPDKPASPPASSPTANADAAEPLPPDRLLDAASPASVVVTAGDDPAALERTLDTFLRRNSFPIRDLIILQNKNARYQALIEKFQKYTFKWLTGDAATAPAAMSAVDATVTAEFIFECEGGWEFTRTGFIEKSLCVLRQNPEVSEVFLGAADAAAGIPLSESVFFADDTPYRLWPTAGDAGDPAAHPAVFHGPKLRRRRDGRTGTAMAEGEGLARRGTLTAVLADGAGQT
jgi:hypothetical protein